MNNLKVQLIKKGRKESLLLREISKLVLQASLDDERLRGLFITHVVLSSDKGVCFVYFYSQGGEEDFKNKFEILKLYKPSMRKAIGQTIESRYVPELVFKYDSQFEKQKRVEELIEKLKKEGQL
jgi:ribosome-binding factor A